MRTVTRTKGFYLLKYQGLYYGNNLVTTDNFFSVSWVYNSQFSIGNDHEDGHADEIADQK